jgi:hypothetical protein
MPDLVLRQYRDTIHGPSTPGLAVNKKGRMSVNSDIGFGLLYFPGDAPLREGRDPKILDLSMVVTEWSDPGRVGAN